MSEVLQAGCRFFNLRVEKLVDTVEIGHKHVMHKYLCKCDCGNEIITTGYSLKCGDTVSCGCMKTSFAEDVVNDYLQLVGYIENDNYFREKTFSDLIGVGGGFLRFDFVVFVVFVGNNIVCVECQGEQHYKSVNYFGGDNQFEIRKQNDEIKRQWCKKKNYILLEVPYTLHTSDEIQNYLAELMNRVSE